MKWIISILLLLSVGWVDGQNLDAHKYAFGSGDGFAAVVKQITKVQVYGSDVAYTGDSVQLRAMISCLEGVSYELKWYKDNGQYLSTGDTLTVFPAIPGDAGDYYCIAKDLLTGIETISDTLTLSIENSVVKLTGVQLAVHRMTFCEGGNDSVWIRNYSLNTDHCSQNVKDKIARGDFHMTWKWKRGDTFLGEGEKYYLRNVTAAESGKYYCELHIDSEDGTFSGWANSDTCEVNLMKRPDLQIQPGEDVKVIFGRSVELKASGAKSYLWNTGSLDSVLTISPVEAATYTVKGYSTAGCYAEKTISVDVIRLKLDLGHDRVIFKGESVTLDIETNADSVLWYEESRMVLRSNLLQATPAMTYLGKGMSMTVSPTETTTYQLQVYFQGAMSAVPLTVTVKDNYSGGMQDGVAHSCLPPRIVQQKGPSDAAGCELASVELMVQPEGTDLQLNWEIFDKNIGDFKEYKGAENVTGVGTNRLTFTTFTAANNGMYRCRITNTCGEVVSDTFALNDKQQPMIGNGGLNADQTLCQDAGDKAQLAIWMKNAKKITYQWYKAPDADGEFTPIDGATDRFIEVPRTPDADGTYRIIASNVCGSDTSQINFNVVTPPVINDFSLDVNVCTGSDANFYVQVGGKGGFNYTLHEIDPKDDYNILRSWTGSPTVTLENVTKNGLFRWEVENAERKCGVTLSENMSLQIDRPLQIKQDITVLDTLVCSGENGFIQLVTFEDDQSTRIYEWRKDGEAVPGQNQNYLHIKNLTQADAGRYQLYARNKCPGLFSNILNLRVNETPHILSSPESQNVHCQGGQLHLKTVASDDFAVDSVRWFLNGYKLLDDVHDVRGAGTPDIYVDSITSSHAGIYVAEYYNVCGASASKPLTIDLMPMAQFDFKLEDYPAVMCKPNRLTVTASGPDLRYKWLFNGDPIIDEFGRPTESSMTNELDLDDIKGWEKTGSYSCLVQNSCGDELSKAYLTFSITSPFNLVGSDSYCQGGDGVTIRLEGSLPKVSYGLYEKERGYSDITITGDDVNPGDTLYFNKVKKGVYYVEAVDTMNCRTVMPGEVTVTEHPWPAKFVSSVARPVCEEGGNGDISLAGSEKYIEYFLCRRNDVGKWDTLSRIYPGTGSPLVMRNIAVGTYKVVARNPISLCEVGMDEILDLQVHKLLSRGKLYAVDMDSIHCVGTTSDVRLAYDQFQPGYVYTLKRNGVMTDKVRKFSPVVFDEVEAGIYCINIKAPDGCDYDIGYQRVLGQDAPRVANLNGEGGIFCEDKAFPRIIELDNTEAGVTYSLYRKLSEVNTIHILDTLSRYGGAMTLEVPTKEGEYYVEAVDATPKHCRVKMNGSITLKQSRFSLNLPGSGGIVKVYDEKNANLTVSANNAYGNVQYYWRKPEDLITPNNQPNVTTVPVTEPILLYVTASDDMGCAVEEEVKVEPYGCAFKGAILDSEGEVAENEQLCRGEAINLKTRWQCGGGVTVWYYGWHYEWVKYWDSYWHQYRWHWVYNRYYHSRYYPYITTYRWYDETGNIAADRYSGKLSYAKKESGWIYCEMTNGLEHQGDIYPYYWYYHHAQWDPQQVKTYKVWVEVQKSPREFMVDSTGLREVVLNSDQTINLRQSDPVVKYTLEYNDGTGFEPVKDQVQMGNGAVLSFVIPGNHVQWGTYRILGEYQNEGDLGLLCKRLMNGTVDIEQRGFKERLQLERALCEGDATADLRITTSSKDAVYFICRQNNSRWDTLPTWYRGTGAAIIVKDVPKGVYKAVVRVAEVDNALNGVVEVEEQPLPTLCPFEFMNNDSTYCWGTSSEVTLTSQCYTDGYSYSLIKDGTDTKEIRRTKPITWNGLLDGVYNIKVTNKEGCSKIYEEHTVFEADPPRQYQLIGDSEPFCDPREEGYRVLTMSSTDPGVEYSFRWRPTGEVLKDTMGDGQPISVFAPLIDRNYYVVATDTLSKCSREMPNDVAVPISKLAVTAEKSIVTVRCGKPAQLKIIVKDAIEPIQVEWNNTEFLADGQKNVQNPYTLPLQDRSIRFGVTVIDSMGCVKTSEVLAECVPEGVPLPDDDPDDRPDGDDFEENPDPYPDDPLPLSIDIMDQHCNDPVDTLMLCQSEKIGLCANVVGGWGKYKVTWFDDVHTLGLYRTVWVRKSESGYLYLKVETTGDKQVAYDTIWVNVGKTPLRNRIANSGLQCLLPEDDLDIVLDGSEAGAIYQLEYSETNVGFDSIAVLEGNGGPLTFHLTKPELGYYQITARFPDEFNCESTMFDYVEVRRKPATFTVSGGWRYCEGSPVEGSIFIDSTELAAQYRLYNGNLRVDSLDGTGTPTAFTGYYEAGIYFVDARIGQCHTNMDGVVSVKTTPKPNVGTVQPAGVLCRTSGPWEISVPQSEEGYSYFLRKKLFGEEAERWEVKAGTVPHALSFGEHSDEGEYVVVAVSDDKKCEFTFPGPDIRYSEPPQADWRVSKCIQGDTGAIRLIDVDTTLEYWMSYNSATPRMVGIYKGDVELEKLPYGKYCLTVKDPETTCEAAEQCEFITQAAPGYVDQVVWSCDGQPISELQVKDAAPGVMYALYYVDDEMGAVYGGLDTCYYPNAVFHLSEDYVLAAGDSYVFRKTRMPEPGGPDDLCSDRIIFDVKYKEGAAWQPTSPANGTTYRMCPEDSCEVRISQLEPNVVYSLELTVKGKTTVIKKIGDTIPRDVIKWDSIWHTHTGWRWSYYGHHWVSYQYKTLELVPKEYRDSLSFGDYFKTAGWYEIYADNGCRKLLSKFNILHVAPPQKRQLFGRDKCMEEGADSLRIYLSQRDEDVSYYLYLDDRIVDSIPYTAPDSIVYFPYQKEVGCYHAWAETNSPTCRSELDRSICLSNPPAVYAIEESDRQRVVCTETDSIPIYLINTDKGVKYDIEKDHVELGRPVEGTGDRMLIGYAKEAGLYTVVAKNGTCTQLMSGEVLIRRGKAPVFQVKDTIRYCESDGGAQIVMEAPTADTLQYTLLGERGELLYGPIQGDRNGKAVTFPALYPDARVFVAVENVTDGCVDTAQVELVKDLLPKAYQLKNVNNGYLCKDGVSEMYLDEAEPGVEYKLWNLNSGLLLGTAEGAGERLVIGAVEQTGTYYATAELVDNRSCRIPMLDTIDIQLAPPIKDFRVETVQKYYCYTLDSAGIIALPSSEADVVYELYKEGKPMGKLKYGNGRRQEWGSLKGKSCDEISPEDEEEDEMGVGEGIRYTVMATSQITGCKQQMPGAGVIIEETEPKLVVCSPSTEQPTCEGEPVYMNVALATGCNLTYILEKDGTRIYADKIPVYSVESVTTDDYGVYHWSVSNSCGEDDRKASFEVTPRDQLRLVKPLEDISFCGREEEKITLTSGFENALVTQWLKLGSDEVIFAGQMLVLNSADQVGTYICRAWNECNTGHPLEDTVVVSYGLPELGATPFIDTVCAGDRVVYPVYTSDNVQWYHNAAIMAGQTQKRLVLNDITHDDEGIYSVRLTNNCGESNFNIATLLVDDTIKVVDVTPDEILCLGDAVQLFVKTQPMERVTYAWYNNTTLLSDGPTCNVGPFEDRVSHSYTVWFSNACSAKQVKKSHTVHINIPKPIKYDDPSSVIMFCADCVTDTVLRLNTDPGILARFQWYCRTNDQEAERTLQDSEADTLSIKMCTRNSGFYYCRIYNQCETKTVKTCWVKVDSMPELTSPWTLNDTICKGQPHTVLLSTSGGNMTYKLHILYRDGREIVKEYPYTTFVSECRYTFNVVNENLDGVQLWWDLENSCGRMTTARKTLTVMPTPTLRISPMDTIVCAGEKAPIVLELKNGKAPWEYGYSVDDGELNKVTDCLTGLDTLFADQGGVYHFTYLKDHNGCLIPGLDLKADVEIGTLSELTISVPQKVCRRDTVEIALKVAGGHGPWKLTLNELNPDKTVTPFELEFTKDTVIKRVYLRLGDYKYYEQSGTFVDTYGGLECPGNVKYDNNIVAIEGGGLVTWNILTSEEERHLPGCEVTDLFDKFVPKKDGVPLRIGDFVLTLPDSTEKTVSGGVLDEEAGKYGVEYVYIADNGCSAEITPASQVIYVDSLPEATVKARYHDICIGTFSTYVDFTFKGSAPFTYNYVVTRYDFDKKVLGTPTYATGKKTSKNKESYRVERIEDMASVVYEMNYLKDSHGCAWKNDTPLRDTIRYRKPSEYFVDVYYAGDTTHNCDDPVYFSRDDSVQIYCKLIEDSLSMPWSIVWVDLDDNSIFSTQVYQQSDTCFWWKRQGIYDFEVMDKNRCGQATSECIALYAMDPGYIKAKLILQGPYSSAAGVMKTQIQSYLPDYGKPLPVVDQPIIDWVYVELRETIDSMPVQVDTCLLLADGTLVDRNGKEAIEFKAAYSAGASKDYHLVFRQRNHLAIATKPIVLGSSETNAPLIDWTTEAGVDRYLYLSPKVKNNKKENHMTTVGKNAGLKWALVVGEVNDNNAVTIFDPNKVAHETLVGGAMNYELLLYDLDFNGKIEWSTDGSGAPNADWLKSMSGREKISDVILHF